MNLTMSHFDVASPKTTVILEIPTCDGFKNENEVFSTVQKVALIGRMVKAGASTLDASLMGVSGCPFAPAATGNIATKDLHYMLDRSGISGGYDFARTVDAAHWLSNVVGRPLPAVVSRTANFSSPFSS